MTCFVYSQCTEWKNGVHVLNQRNIDHFGLIPNGQRFIEVIALNPYTHLISHTLYGDKRDKCSFRRYNRIKSVQWDIQNGITLTFTVFTNSAASRTYKPWNRDIHQDHIRDIPPQSTDRRHCNIWVRPYTFYYESNTTYNPLYSPHHRV